MSRQAPAFDPNAPHQNRPHLRPVRGFPTQMGDQQMLGLADARQISDRMVVAPMAAQSILPLLNGERSITEIVTQVGRGLTAELLQQFVAQLDDAGLLHGPKFDALLADMRREFDSTATLPPAATGALATGLVSQKLGREATQAESDEQGAAALREVMDQWIAKSLEGEASQRFDTLPKAVMAPHIDYPRGWMNYGTVWGRLRGFTGMDRPDRVVILGTNHFGMGTGVTACDKGFQTPLGTCQTDTRLLEAIKSRLGPGDSQKLLANRYDHEREHSVELQVAWIQHCLGTDAAAEYCPILGILIHDPSVNNGESYDGSGLALRPFVEALRAAIEEVGGKTLIVASADLSHVGPMFGDKEALAGEGAEAAQARNRVVQHDQEMLQHVAGARADDLIAAMAWQQNPTRWCSVGNIAAALMTVRPERVQVLRYMAAMDPQGMGMVSSAGAAMW